MKVLGIFSAHEPQPEGPMPNGCWRCIGCRKILPKHIDWNQCADCDTREPEEMPRFSVRGSVEDTEHLS